MFKLGIDLGGTNIVAGVVDDNYKIIATAKRKTAMPRPAEKIADDMADACREAVAKAGITLDDIDACGVGTPGSVKPKEGIVTYANNLKFSNVNLSALMFERLGKSFFAENDANAAAYGEFLAGAGKGYNSLVAVTLGTGVGSGIIIDGKLYTGFNNAAGELGHIVISMNGEACTCGRLGCFETYASATALIRQTKQMMLKYPESIMWEMCDNNIENVNGITAFDAMRKGDMAGKMTVDKYIEYLATGVANIINTFQPEVLCIGGGISHEGDTLIKPLEQIVNGENYARATKEKTIIKAAKLGNDAGLIGAAFLCNLYGK